MMRRRGVGVVGVAAVAHHASKKGAQQQAAADQQAEQAAEQQAAAAAAAPAPVAAVAPAPAPVAPAGIDMEQLKQLGDLHTAGILTDEEFAAQKAKLLGGWAPGRCHGGLVPPERSTGDPRKGRRSSAPLAPAADAYT